MIKFLVFIFIALFLTGCNKNTLEWNGYCLPYEKLSPASLAVSSKAEEGFDSASNYGPTLFFSAQSISEKIDDYKTYSTDPLFGQYHHNIQINLSETEVIITPTNKDTLEASGIKDIYFEKLTEYDWNAFLKLDKTYEFWGHCMLDGRGEKKEGFSCTRQLKVDDIVLTFDLENTHIPVSKHIDEFLVNQLNNWRCD